MLQISRWSPLCRHSFSTTTAKISTPPKLAVIKVGGGVLTEEMPIFVKSIASLQAQGLHPVIVHGAGPQLNQMLMDSYGIEPEYRDGIRFTDAKTLEIAKKCFIGENVNLVDALESNGLKARSLCSGIFEASYLDRNRYGFVGKITSVSRPLLDSCIRCGAIPVVTSLAETREGQILNVNADTAASELAQCLQPNTIVFVNSTGGMVNPNTQARIERIVLESEFEILRDDFSRAAKKGTLVKLNEIKVLLDGLPNTDSVSITNASNMGGGGGTIIHKRTLAAASSMQKQQRRPLTTSTQEVKRKKLALIGARGFTGQEIINLIDRHPHLELAHISSRELAGKTLSLPLKSQKITYENLSAEDVGKLSADKEIDAVILALPNKVGGAFVDAIKKQCGSARMQYPVIVDLSADKRFSDEWVYGLPELYNTRKVLRGEIKSFAQNARLISNPGCYATSSQFALYPFYKAGLVDAHSVPVVFGISGYSGAGTTSSPKNDPAVLADNILPYSQVNHLHEMEVGRHLLRALPFDAKAARGVNFIPNVAPFFRGLITVVNVPLSKTITENSLRDMFENEYAGERLVRVLKEGEGCGSDGTPLPRDAANQHGCLIGGFKVGSTVLNPSDLGKRTADSKGKRAVVVTGVDNLLKGAATQAIQNLNLAMGWDEYESIP